MEPRSFIRALSAMMEEDAILTADPGQGQIWAAINFTQKEGRFLTSGGLGTMGYALPAALGAKLAKPRRQVLAVCGDGGLSDEPVRAGHGGGLSRAAEGGACLITGAWAWCGSIKTPAMPGGTSAPHMDGNPDFVALCQAYGIPAALARNNREAERLAREMLQSPRPYVLVCRVDRKRRRFERKE